MASAWFGQPRSQGEIVRWNLRRYHNVLRLLMRSKHDDRAVVSNPAAGPQSDCDNDGHRLDRQLTVISLKESGAMSEVENGLYSIQITMGDGSGAHASGVIVLVDGRILGGDSHFYYSGSYTFKNGKWRGELTTSQHTRAVGVNFLFGGREVTCGFTGTYGERSATVDGTALVGKNSIQFKAKLDLAVPLN